MTAGEELPAEEDRPPERAAETDAEPIGPVRAPAGRVRLKWAGEVLVAAVVLGAVGGLIAGFADRAAVPAGLTAGGAVALVGLVWVVLRYRAWSFQLRDDALYLERGVVTHVETVVPHVRIQHVDTNRGPVDRLLGLSTLVVYTAGSRGADVAIPGLPTDEAAELQERVKGLAIEAEGGDAL